MNDSLHISPLAESARRGLRDHVHATLRAAIVGGRFAEGSRLNERELATKLGVSTTPVKEAFRHLEAEGLVEAIPRRGVRVKFNRLWAEEMILARAVLESAIAGLAAQRAEAAVITGLNSTVERMKVATESGSLAALVSLNREFHGLIHRASRSRHLPHLIEQQDLYDDAIRRVIHQDSAQRALALGEHNAIYQAIARHEPDEAERLMKAHVLRSGEHYLGVAFPVNEGAPS